MSRLKVLTRKNFRDWLSNHHPRTIAGYCAKDINCPISRYLQQELKNPFIEVSNFSAIVYFDNAFIKGKEYDIPKWAENFIEAVDDFKESYAPVTYGTCLRLLKES